MNPVDADQLPPAGGPLALALRLQNMFNRAMLLLSMMALVATATILTYSVVVRYFLRRPTDWQDEVAVFMLVGVIFLCAAYVQSVRGHIGIEAFGTLLTPRLNQMRMLLIDLISLFFCVFFSWKSWTLLIEAVIDGQTTSSTFGAPLWIPYSMMALGMSMLSVQLLLQILVRVIKQGPAA